MDASPAPDVDVDVDVGVDVDVDVDEECVLAQVTASTLVAALHGDAEQPMMVIELAGPD